MIWKQSWECSVAQFVRSRAGTIQLPKSLPGHHSHRISPRGLRVLGKAASSCASERANCGFRQDRAEGFIDLLYVHPEFQRQGVACELFAELCSWAERRGIRHLRSEVSITARPFFESAGFRVVERQVVERRGVWFSNFVMETPLFKNK